MCRHLGEFPQFWRLFCSILSTMFWECHVTSGSLQPQVTQFLLRQGVLVDIKRDLSTSTDGVEKVQILFFLPSWAFHLSPVWLSSQYLELLELGSLCKEIYQVTKWQRLGCFLVKHSLDISSFDQIISTFVSTKMTLQWTFAAGFLYLEIGILFLFCIPFISPRRQAFYRCAATYICFDPFRSS